MSFWDRLVWEKLLGNPVQYPINPLWLADITIDTNALPVVGPHKLLNSSAGPTSFEDVINIEGRGELVYLAVKKPVTVNTVSARIRITVDGVVIAADIAVSGTTTAQDFGLMVTWGWSSDDSGTRKGISAGPIKFNQSLLVEFKFSSTPGASEVAQAAFWYWFT